MTDCHAPSRWLFPCLVIGAAFALAGCFAPNDAREVLAPPEEGPCAYYPTKEEMLDTWYYPFANQTQEGYDTVSVGVARWGLLEPGQWPDLYIDWAEYPDSARPQIFSDLLCYAWWQIQHNERLDERYSPTTITSKGVAEAALQKLELEHHFQTGATGWDDGTGYGCCYLIFDGLVFGTGCMGLHVTWVEGGSTTTGCS